MTNIQLVWQLIIDKIKHTTQTQRAVLAIWFIAIVLGIALTVAIVLLLSIQSLTILISLLACGLIALTSYFVSISLYRSLKVNEDFTEEDKNGFLIDRRDRLIGQHGWRYLTWFIGHSFSWLTVCLGIATLLVNMFGLRPFSLAISAGLLTCSICSLFGLILFAKRPLLLGICWQQIDWRQVADWWESISVTLFLRERHKQIVAQDLQKPNSTYRKIIAILDSEPVPSESVGSKVDLWEQGSFSHNWRREQWQRVRVLFMPFLATLLLALPLFIFIRPSLSDTAVTLTQKYGTSTAENRPDDTMPDGASTNSEAAPTAVANNDVAETEHPNFAGDDGNQELDNANTTNKGDETDRETGGDGRTPGSNGVESERPSSETNSEAGTTSESSSNGEDSISEEANGSEPGASSNSSPEDAGDTSEESDSSEAGTSSESPPDNESETSEETGSSEPDTSSESSSESESDASEESGSSETNTSSESAPESESDASEESGSSETDTSSESPAESESETSEETGDSENGQPNDESNSNGSAEPGTPAEDAGDGVEESDGPSLPEPGDPQQNGENDGISSDIDDSGDLSSTPGVAETFVNEPPVPSGSEQRIDIELPPLQMNSGLGEEDSPEATAVPPETDENLPGFRRYPQPPKTTPLPSQRTPNWIRILFIN